MGNLGKTGWFVVLVALPVSARDLETEMFVCKPGNYRLRLPGEPRPAVTNGRPSAGGATSYVLRTSTRITYEIRYKDVTQDEVKPDKIATLLEATVDSHLTSANGSPTERKNIPLGAHPGRDVRFRRPAPSDRRNPDAGALRVYLVGTRLYSISVVGPAGSLTKKQVAEYLDGFSLLETVTPVSAPASNGSATTPSGPKGGRVVTNFWGKPLDPDQDCNIRNDRGTMVVAIPGKRHDLAPALGLANAPRLLQDVEGNFVVEVQCASYVRPGSKPASPSGVSYAASGLLYYKDDEHFIRLEHGAVAAPEPGGARIRFEKNDDQTTSHSSEPPVPPSSGIRLRLERRGAEMRGSYCLDGKTWQALEPLDLTGWGERGEVGVMAVNTASTPFRTSFRQFRLEHQTEEPQD
jgi:regulation of enolase protein 1 (concanavalin A-like superfamily)